MDYDLCIVGAGPAGYSGAIRAARAGKKVALVERDRVGGTCLNRGCIPTKALRQCAESLLAAKEAGRFGVVLPAPTFDFSAAARHRDDVTAFLVGGVASLIKAAKISLVTGEGRIRGPGQVVVEGAEGRYDLAAEQIIVATGSRPRDLPGIKIDEDRVLSSEGAVRLAALPASVIVIGGGVIGCEFADLLAAFGSRVTVVEVMPRILLTEDRALAKAVQLSLASRGVKFLLKTTLADLQVSEAGVRATLPDGSALEAEKMIVSVGRRPALEGLGLEAAGIAVEKGAIQVDSRGRASRQGFWAAGDVIGPPLLAHVASHEMEVVIDNLLGRAREFDRAVIPAVTFVRPELASVGLGEDAAKEKNIPVRVGRFAYLASGKAQCMGETDGMVKVVAGEDGRILGGAVLGTHAGELIHEIALAIKGKLTVKDLTELIHAHPTLSELVLEAAADTMGLAVHKIGKIKAPTDR